METENTKSRILVVDDEVKACGLLKKFLERRNYLVETANNGEEALHKIKEFDPAIVLLDILMPGIPGDKIIKLIKKWKPELEVLVTQRHRIDNRRSRIWGSGGAWEHNHLDAESGSAGRRIRALYRFSCRSHLLADAKRADVGTLLDTHWCVAHDHGSFAYGSRGSDACRSVSGQRVSHRDVW